MTRVAKLQDEPRPFAVSIEHAAKMVALGTTKFYEVFLDTGRVRPVEVGRRKVIVVDELRRAFDLYVAETRAAQDDKPIADLPAFDPQASDR